jgi:hypothetical protein
MRAHEFVTETRKVFKKKPGSSKMSMKWRCSAGPRKGRVVADPAQCSAAPDIAKSAQMKRTRARTAIRQARKAKRTKRLNPISKLTARLNRYL